jgi:hypothetical protein
LFLEPLQAIIFWDFIGKNATVGDFQSKKLLESLKKFPMRKIVALFYNLVHFLPWSPSSFFHTILLIFSLALCGFGLILQHHGLKGRRFTFYCQFQ